MADPEHILDGILIDDPPMSSVDRNAIRILGTEEAHAAWCELVCRTGRHLMLLPDDAWPCQLMKTPVAYHWYSDWNADRFQPMSDLLSALRGETERILVFWGRSTAVEVPNGVFARNWINFLYEDEGCLVVAHGDDRRCILSNGYFWVSGRD